MLIDFARYMALSAADKNRLWATVSAELAAKRPPTKPANDNRLALREARKLRIYDEYGNPLNDGARLYDALIDDHADYHEDWENAA